MNIRAIDLQLLVALDVLLEELHVTRASEKLGLSQPATSHLLARLREQFSDPLLVRTAQGLVPTDRALALKQPVRAALLQVQKVFGAQPAFQPHTSHESFTLRMGDMNEFILLPTVARELRKEAPNISLEIRHVPPLETVRGLDADDLHFAIGTGLIHPKSIRSIPLVDDHMVCIMRKDHPAARKRLTLKTFLALKHIRIAQAVSDTRFVDEYLPNGAQRQVSLTIPHWLAAPSLVAATDLVTAISRRMAELVNREGLFTVHPLPFGPKSFKWCLYWHARYDAHPAHRWMREFIQRACTSLV